MDIAPASEFTNNLGKFFSGPNSYIVEPRIPEHSLRLRYADGSGDGASRWEYRWKESEAKPDFVRSRCSGTVLPAANEFRNDREEFFPVNRLRKDSVRTQPLAECQVEPRLEFRSARHGDDFEFREFL